MKPYIVITGCGSSGTGFTAKALNKAGVQAKHERAGRDAIVSWYLGAKDVRLPSPKASGWSKVPTPYVLLHQTRHPLKVISTVQAFRPESWDYMGRCLPGVFTPDLSLIQRCMRYWYHWNLLVEQQRPSLRYQVERLPELWDMVCDVIERPGLPNTAQDLSKTTHSRAGTYKALTWRDLRRADAIFTHEVRKLGKRYGYGD